MEALLKAGLDTDSYGLRAARTSTWSPAPGESRHTAWSSAPETAGLQTAGEEEEKTSTNFQRVVGVYAAGAVCVTGVAGNVLSLAVLARCRMSGSLFVLMRALTCADIGVLLGTLLIQVLVELPLDQQWQAHNPFWRFHGHLVLALWPLVMAAKTCVVWLTVGISFERYIAICLPHRARCLLTVRRARIAIALIGALALSYNAPKFFEHELRPVWRPAVGATEPPDAGNASRPSGNANATESALETGRTTSAGELQRYDYQPSALASTPYSLAYSVGLYSALMFVLPVLALLTCNVSLLAALEASRRTRARMSRAQRKEQRITRAPLCMVLVFLLCAVPSLAINVLDPLCSYVPVVRFSSCLFLPPLPLAFPSHPIPSRPTSASDPRSQLTCSCCSTRTNVWPSLLESSP